MHEHTKNYPHEEVPIEIKITNNGSNTLDLSQLDLGIRLEDVYGSLPVITDLKEYFVEGTAGAQDPYIQYHHDDFHYFLLNTVSTPSLASGESFTILAFTILPPEELLNLQGAAKITVDFVRLELDDGTCCVLDSDDAYGTIEYDGDSPCTEDPVLSFTVESLGATNPDECESTIRIHTHIDGSSSTIDITEFFLEFSTLSTDNLEIVEIVGDNLFTYDYDCMMENCPGNNMQTCQRCTGSISYGPSSTIVLIDGGYFDIVYKGMDESVIEEFDFTQAYIRYSATPSPDRCIPEVDDSGFEQILNECTYCFYDHTVHVEEYSGTQTLGNCEEAFSIYLTSPTDPILLMEEVKVEIEFLNPQGLTVTIIDEDCFNDNNGCPQSPGVLECTYTNGSTKAGYHFCKDPNSTNGFPTSGKEKLFDVKISGSKRRLYYWILCLHVETANYIAVGGSPMYARRHYIAIW